MNSFPKNRVVLGSAILLLSLSHCSHGPAVQPLPDTASAPDEVRSLGDDVSAAATKQVDVLAPKQFDKAQQALNEARQDLLQGDSSRKDTLHEVAEGRAYLDQANRTYALAQTNMPEVIQARQQAVNAGAPELFDTDFRKTDENLRQVSSDLEQGKTATSQKYRTAFQHAYLNLELRSIKQSNLGTARAKIDKAIRSGAKEYAPQTLAIAQQNLKDTDAFITANRHDDQVKTRSEATEASADHLLKILAIAKTNKSSSSEQTALQMEKQENQVLSKEAQLDNQGAELSMEKDNAQKLSETNQELAATDSFNKRFEQARAQFSDSEAEVYRQGNALVIRLKSLDFPKSQANLTGSSFPLLAKVQKVIQDFPGSSVTIQGNTDSTGTKETNNRLSAERADAVRDYLVANNAIEADKVKTVGNGDLKPLASNKTAEGRAENRRVDVVIVPEVPEPPKAQS